MRRIAPRVLALAVVLSHAGCEPAASRDRGASTVSHRAAGTMSISPPDSLRLRLEVPREAPLGASVPITLRMENVAGRPLELYLRGREITFDVVVARADGEVIWRRLAGEIIPAIVQLRTLAPGEAVALRTDWDQRVAGRGRATVGDYVVRGALLTEHPEPLETAGVPLRITRP
jgi:hypothetical protein